MTYGFQITSDAGVPGLSPEVHGLIRRASGTSAPSTGLSVYFPATYIAPVLFVRPTTQNCAIMIMEVTNGSFSYSCPDCPIDWVVYEAGPIATTDENQHGMRLFSDTGAITFDSNYPPPEVISAGFAAQSQPSSSSWTNETSFVGAAHDGGLPYISASSLLPALMTFIPAPRIGMIFSIQATYTSPTNIHWSLMQTYQFSMQGYEVVPLGAYPRPYMIIR